VGTSNTIQSLSFKVMSAASREDLGATPSPKAQFVNGKCANGANITKAMLSPLLRSYGLLGGGGPVHKERESVNTFVKKNKSYYGTVARFPCMHAC